MAAGPETVTFFLQDWQEFVKDLYMNADNGTDAAELAAAFREGNSVAAGGCLHERTRAITTMSAGAKTFCVACNVEIK